MSAAGFPSARLSGDLIHAPRSVPADALAAYAAIQS